MQIFGVLGALGFFALYFSMKFTYALRANSYSRLPTLAEVWSFSFEGHPMRRNIVPMKYISIFFAITGLFGWGIPLSQHDQNKLWQFPLLLLVGANNWARMTIYEFTHWKNGIEKSMPGIAYFEMMRRSIKEIGWFPDGDDWLSRLVVVSNIFIVAICVVRLTLLLL